MTTRWSEHPYYAAALTSAFVAAVFGPTVLGLPDSFPLSTYPMFAKPRGQPEMVKFVAVDEAGAAPIRPEWLGTGEVLQAKALLEQVANRPSAQRRKFCAETAARLASLPEARTWQELRLIRAKFDPIDYFYNGGKPVSESVLTHCPVGGGTPPSAEQNP